MSVATLWFVLRGPTGTAEKTSLLLAHAFTQFLGLALVGRLESMRREGFFAHLDEQRVRANLEIQKHRAETSAKARSDFLALMSHELRTPMHAVLGLSEALGATPLSAAQRDLVRSIHGGAHSLFVVLADILELAGLEADRVPGAHAPFALKEAVESAIDVVRHEATARGRSVDLEMAKDVPAGLCGNALRLRQTLIHLLFNTLASAERGPVVLSVSARALEGDEREITFAVQGAGIGLSVRAQEVEPPPPAPRPSDPDHGSAVPWDLRVLVVDDSALNIEVALALLGTLGLGADVASSGKEALDAALRKEYDLIFMDLRMPEMDGFEATRRIFAALPPGRRPRVVALSANPVEQDRAACREVGMSEFLPKPLRAWDLRAALVRAASGGEPPPHHEPAPAPAAQGSSARPRLDPAAIALLRSLATPDFPAFLATVCGKFLADVGPRLDRMANAAATGDAEAAGREAHTLKTACATVGAWEMSAACAALEAAALRDDLSAYSATIEALRADLVQVGEALSQEVGAKLATP